MIIASHDPNILKSANIVIDLSTKPIPRIGVRKRRKLMLKEEETLELAKIVRKENNSFLIIFLIIFLIFLLSVSMGYYFNNAKLDIIAETDGVVIPSSKG